MRRARLAAAVVLLTVVAAAGGWFAGQRIVSPAEAAARTAPPEPSLITVPVERRVLTSEIVVRGTVAAEGARTVRLAGVPEGEAAAVVTRPAEPGRELTEGAVVMEVSGRPVLVLTGAVPAYRDLRPGDVGDDVRQLEEALARLGHDPGAVDGTYDAATESAVSRWYRAAGYEPAGPSQEERERVAAAAAAEAEAKAAVRAAEQGLAQAKAGPPAADVLEADAAVRAAEAGVATTTAEARQAEAEAAAAVVEASAALDAARADGTQDVQAADAALAAARQAAEAAQQAGRSAVAQAQDQVAVARARRAELDARPDAAPAQAELAAARDAAERAAQDLVAARRGVGVHVPAGELVFLPGLPLRVEAALAPQGGDATGDAFSVAGAGLVVKTAFSLAEAELVTAGTPVRIAADDAGVELTGTLASIAERPGTDGQDAQHRAATVVPDGAGPELKDASVRVTVPVESTDGDVLAVPLPALSAAADGSSRVEVESGPGHTRVVRVEPGLTAQGLVEVRPEEGALAEGDRVVVGR